MHEKVKAKLSTTITSPATTQQQHNTHTMPKHKQVSYGTNKGLIKEDLLITTLLVARGRVLQSEMIAVGPMQ